jgi:hypothetical protein
MRKQDYLLHVIGSLSTNERRYFQLFSSIQPGEKRYMKLFEALENKSHYDAGELCKELGITAKQLGDEKNYLAQALLKSLRNFDDEANPINNLQNSLLEARSLFLRGGYDYALELTEKILKRAKAIELTYLMPEIIIQKQSCLRMLMRFDELKELDQENEIALLRYKEHFEIMQLNFAVTAVEQLRQITPEAKKLFEHPLLKKGPGDLQSLRSFTVWFKLKSRQQTMLNTDIHEWVKLVRQCIKFVEKSSNIYEINPLGFFYMYTDLANAEALVGNYDEALSALNTLLKKMQDAPASISPAGLEGCKRFALSRKRDFLIYLQRYAEAMPLTEKLYRDYSEGPEYDKFTAIMMFAISLVHTGQPAKAAEKVNEVLQMNTDVFTDLQPYVRPLMVMAQLDLGNYVLISYLIKSARAWMKRKKFSSHEVERFFTLTHAIAVAPQTLHRQRWIKLKEAADSGEFGRLGSYLHLKRWIDRKLRIA